MIDPLDTLKQNRLPYLEYGVTAIDSYLGVQMKTPLRFILVEGSLIDLAKAFENLNFPSLPYADAALGMDAPGSGYRFLCVDDLMKTGLGATPFSDFRRNPVSGHFLDPLGVYEELKKRSFDTTRIQSGRKSGDPAENELFEVAVLLSRLAPETPGAVPNSPLPHAPHKLWQRDLLSLVLQGPNSAGALQYLLEQGFVDAYWPDLAALVQVDHAKDCHPEGGGWSHTMEALRHRKAASLTLSLAILLHDVGKARSEAREGRKFDRHAEIGATLASRFLRSLDFDEKIIEDVRFLIRWHMMPAALPRIPLSTVGDIVFDERFPELLELYRCDEFSTFKGPDEYYAACAAYRKIKKHVRNPYRRADGRKNAQAFPNTALGA